MDDSRSEREQRLAAALRANLVRRKQEGRKQQARLRDGAESDASGDPREQGGDTPGPDRSAGKA